MLSVYRRSDNTVLMQGLTRRQQQILDFITHRINDQGYPPTIREIGEEMGIRSTNGVNDHLKALERKGFLRREGLKSRALRPVHMEPTVSGPSPSNSDHDRGSTAGVPVLGRVAAGAPILADENIETTVFVDSFFLGAADLEKIFALRVSGESMINAGIFDGDFIFVRKQSEARRGDVVVAMIDGEATVKRYEPDGDVVRFVAENASMAPIVVQRSDFRNTAIVGVVCGVYRRI